MDNLSTIIFSTNDYKGVKIDKKLLEQTDKNVMCSSLIYKSPSSFGGIKELYLRNLSIFDAKELLRSKVHNRVSAKDENALAHCVFGLGIQGAQKVKDAINFYEEQVVRQYFETSTNARNLFTLNRKKKQKIVEEEYASIVNYLVENSLACIWGDLSASCKAKLLYSINGKGHSNEVIRNNTINMITDYTTLGELESGVIKTKALDRFIIKKVN